MRDGEKKLQLIKIKKNKFIQRYKYMLDQQICEKCKRILKIQSSEVIRYITRHKNQMP